jgi:hypothetical protein
MSSRCWGDMENLKAADIRELVQHGELVAATEGVEAWFKAPSGNWKEAWVRDWAGELILHRASVERLRVSSRKGMITTEQEHVELNHISRRILELVDEIDRKRGRVGRSSDRTVQVFDATPPNSRSF